MGIAAGCEAAEAVRKAESKSVDLRRAAADVNSLARLEPMRRVGELMIVERSDTTGG